MSRPIFFALLVFTLTGCAVVPERAGLPKLAGQGELSACGEWLAELDRAVEAADVQNGGSFPVAGFPYLRVNRFLASFRDQAQSAEETAAWLGHMQVLDLAARAVELRNLPPEASARFGPGASARIAECGDRLRAHDLADPVRLAALREAAVAPDEYIEWQRILGVYPLTQLFVLRGVGEWHAQARESFRFAPADYPRQRLYGAGATDARRRAEEILLQAPRDALGIPQLSGQKLEALVAAHAPVWQVAEEGPYDRIGRPLPGVDGPAFDPARVETFWQLSYTRFGDRVLPQLSYMAWFSERPPRSRVDILAGRLDSVILRVTLDADGQPLLYDSIHGCGCWHQFFPTARLREKAAPAEAEPPLVFSPAPVPGGDERVVVALASATHYVDGLYAVPASQAPAATYTLRRYDELLSQPGPRGWRSLFSASGIAPGTERLERYLLWPMAVPEPGATRQWGRHATAFVGERHFDDPDLIERLFHRAEPAEKQEKHHE